VIPAIDDVLTDEPHRPHSRGCWWLEEQIDVVVAVQRIARAVIRHADLAAVDFDGAAVSERHGDRRRIVRPDQFEPQPIAARIPDLQLVRGGIVRGNEP
jgi:hypothetical protein